MTAEWSLPAWVLLATLGVVLALVLLLGVLLARGRAATARALGAAQAEAEALKEQVAAIERRLDRPVPAAGAEASEYKITMLGEERPDAADQPAPAPVVPGPLFADLVLREGLVQAASLGAGLRRALAPETRNRIRFEMRRDLKRARKQRRADLREARRELDARRRAGATRPGTDAA